MAIKRSVTALCQCCGERKAIAKDEQYCADCTAPNTGSMFVVTEKSSKAIFSIPGSKRVL